MAKLYAANIDYGAFSATKNASGDEIYHDQQPNCLRDLADWVPYPTQEVPFSD